jgi:DNA modification methylase
MNDLKINLIELSLLTPYANNTRIHDDDQIKKVAKSIEEFGFLNPVLIDESNMIIAGHCRVLAAQLLSLEKIPCIQLNHLSDAQKRAFMIADNKLALDASWNLELLKLEIDKLKELDYDFSITGFNDDECSKLFKEEANIVEDNYEVNILNNVSFFFKQFEDNYEVNIPEAPKAKSGDIYQLGKHRLMCGDSTSESDVKKLVNGISMDLCLTDPPYNVDYGNKAESINKYGYKFSKRHIENDCMPDFQFLEFLDKTFANLNKMLKPGGVFYIFHASSTLLEFEEALRLNNLKSRQQLIWNKSNFVLSRQDYHWKHEPILYGWKEGSSHYFIYDRTQSTMIEDELDLNKLKKEELIDMIKNIFLKEINTTTVINDKKPALSPEHPTMKPISLMGKLIINSSIQDQTVLDLFGGSGSTLISCEQLNRQCYMMELDPRYVDVIIDRWETFTGQKAILINGK